MRTRTLHILVIVGLLLTLLPAPAKVLAQTPPPATPTPTMTEPPDVTPTTSPTWQATAAATPTSAPTVVPTVPPPTPPTAPTPTPPATAAPTLAPETPTPTATSTPTPSPTALPPTPTPVVPGGRPPVTPTLPLTATEVQIGPGGGKLRSSDGRVEVQFPAGAVKAPVTARYSPTAVEADDWALCAFSLTARERDRADVQVHRFTAPLTIVVQVDPDRLAQARAEYVRRLALWYWDTGQENWIQLPSHVNPHAGTITAQVTHFTDFLVGGEDPFEDIPPLPSVNDFDSDLFTGAATVHYPIAVPPGNSGLAPEVQLAFNSQSLAEVKEAKEASWVGQGWSLDLPHIIWRGGNKYYLVLGNVKGKIVGESTPIDPQGYIYLYHLVDTQYLRIWRDFSPAGGGDFFLRTKDGTLYEFRHRATTCVDNGQQLVPKTYRWSVSRIVDTHNNQNRITFEYDKYTVITGGCPKDKYVYAKVISYGGDNHQRYKVHFIHSQRADATHYDKLDRTDVKVNGTLAWYYVFTYDDDPNNAYKGRLTLLKIQRYSYDNNSLPPYTFIYAIQDNKVILTEARNGYGGKVTYAYEQFLAYTGTQRHRVTSRTVHDGLDGPDHIFPTTYSYTYSAGNCDKFVGHSHVEVIDSEDGHTHYWFHLDTCAYNPLLGRCSKVEHRAADNQTVLAWEESHYSYRHYSNGSGASTVHWYFARLDQADSHLGTKETHTIYDYDDYGNQFKVREYDGNGALYRTTLRGYTPNEDLWLVGLPSYENVYAGDINGSLQASTAYAYDGHGFGVAPGPTGELTQVRRVIRIEGNLQYMAEVAYDYDGWGNRTHETVYAGESVFNLSTWQYDSPPSDPRTTVTSYHGTYCSYPTQITNALNHTTTYNEYDFVLGVLKQVTDPNGLVTRYYYDVFGRLTKAQYPDDPGSADDQVSFRREYVSDGTPGQQRITTWRGRGADKLWEEQFYNGLGQTIQVHRKLDAAWTQEVRTSWAYDGLGRVQKEWVAYSGAHGENGGHGAYGYVPPAAGGPKTEYAYDALGRVTQVTNPDNTMVRTFYQNWTRTVVDENNHQKVYESDAFGRLKYVREYTGVYGSATLYATTTYSYDVLDHLVQVQDTATPSNVTTMSYDKLGRKTAMTDRDMGSWAYTYDAVGNLKTQKDARNQTITFSYDSLDRLTGKTYSDGSPAVSYTYDQGTNGKGQRTGMSDASGSSTYYYAPDPRGRLVKEQKVINGTGGGTFVTQWSYDSLDRVVWVKYPGGPNGETGEQVNTTYDARGLPYSLVGTGSDTYVHDADYNALGQISTLDFGTDGGAQTTYTYYGETGASPPSGYDNDPSFRLMEIKTVDGGGQPVQHLRYGYDAVGNVEYWWNQHGPGGAAESLTFSYDDLDRLKSVSGAYSRSYQYNAIGNLTNKAGVVLSYPASGPSSVRPHAVSSTSAGGSFGYDNNGNMTSRREASGQPTYTQAFDAENRLVSVTGNGQTTTFTYDGDGARVKKVDPDGSVTIYIGDYYEEVIPPGEQSVALPTGRWAAASAGRPPGPAQSSKPDETLPSGADAGWWAQAQDNIRHQEYAVSLVAADGIYQAPNRAHNLRTRFYPDRVQVERRTGGDWRWTWTLAGLGRAGDVRPVEAATRVVSGNRVAYRRGDLTEWYVNDERGLEQGFQIASAPPGTGDLVLEGIIGGGLTMRAAGEQVHFVNAAGQVVLAYGDLHVVDAAGRPVPARLVAVGDRLRIQIADAGHVYPLLVAPLLTTPDWTAESDQGSARFGLSVSTAGDVNGDGYEDVIVGAHLYDNGQSNEGRAYVYHGSAAGLSTTPAWTAESDQANAHFGVSVSTAGDVNGDGYADVIVGARLYDNGQSNEGRAYVYHGSATGLGTTPAWTAESEQAGARFGFPVSTAGDVNGDGYADVIVGAPFYDNGQTDEGRAYVYYGSAAGLSATPAWTVEGNQDNAYFGRSVSAAGDVNGDGYADVIVGAHLYDSGQTDEGRAYVYHGSAAGLSTTPAWTAESNQTGARFGRSVSGAGDVNGDGYADVIVGAHYYDNGQTDEGRAYVYLGSASGLGTTAAWTAEGNQASAAFGCSVSGAGDVNGDGYADVIVGAPYYDDDQTDEGRAYVYHGSATGLSTTPAWTVESDQESADFGRSVSGAGDVNGDGYDDVIVGAPFYDNGQTDEGRAYVYLSDGTPPAPEALVRKYYYFNGKRVAMRKGPPGTSGDLIYLHTDHLGSTSLATNASGTEVVARQWYYPYGDQRHATAELPTDYRFTGQRNESTIGLYDYGARFYDPLLGRFLSADTVVPNPGNPQAFNRYSYCVNNPLRYVDPTGHKYDPYGDDSGREEDLDPDKAREAEYARNVVLDQGEAMMDWRTYLPTNPDNPFFEEPKGKYRLTGGSNGSSIIGYSVPHNPPISYTKTGDWHTHLKANPQTVLSWLGLNPKIGIVSLDYDIFTVDQRLMVFYEKVHNYEIVEESICWQPGKGVWVERTLGKDEGEGWMITRILKQFQFSVFDHKFGVIIEGPSWLQ